MKRADNLETAADLAHAWRPSVIVLDFLIGHRTCVEVLPELRQASPHARIVIHTASRRAAEASGATAASADAVIEKNHYTIDDLIDRLHTGVDEHGQDGEVAG